MCTLNTYFTSIRQFQSVMSMVAMKTRMSLLMLKILQTLFQESYIFWVTQCHYTFLLSALRNLHWICVWKRNILSESSTRFLQWYRWSIVDLNLTLIPRTKLWISVSLYQDRLAFVGKRKQFPCGYPGGSTFTFIQWLLHQGKGEFPRVNFTRKLDVLYMGMQLFVVLCLWSTYPHVLQIIIHSYIIISGHSRTSHK